MDLLDNPQETFYTNSVPNPRISEAKLEAELKEWFLSEGGFVPSSKSSKKTIGTDSLKPLKDSQVKDFHVKERPDVCVCVYIVI